MKPIVSIVVAIAQNGVIGAKGDLPWKLSSDLKRFKRDTMDKPIIMGRKTWESIGRPLPGRPNIIVTRQDDYDAEGANVVGDLDSAISLATELINSDGLSKEICLIGGGELYKQALVSADRLYVTHVLAEPEGDTHFPTIDPAEWQPVCREAFFAGDLDSADTIYVVYERKRGS